ncbi:hypothetical protein FOE78_20890 [Microlunatus elymi]|uniref:Uncharacterized protein n=1 Tax=Microlunatus elymi TaxID=2596828 RepID=A0A516Q3L6_9ACTN|nr:hypothetical protein [Microlunatus elymi]QDP98027.1 hypothetical protein FOE78_20890 [Microlunatus elymi]
MKITAVAQRSSAWWAIRIPEVEGAFTQARRLDLVPGMAAEAVGMLLDIDPASIEVTVEPHTDQDSLIAQAREARRAADEAATEAARTMRQAAQHLLAENYTVRDAGRLLGLSPQRVSQLAHQELVDA